MTHQLLSHYKHQKALFFDTDSVRCQLSFGTQLLIMKV